MTVEFPDHLLAARDLERIRAEYPLQASNQSPLARALLADQHQRDFG